MSWVEIAETHGWMSGKMTQPTNSECIKVSNQLFHLPSMLTTQFFFMYCRQPKLWLVSYPVFVKIIDLFSFVVAILPTRHRVENAPMTEERLEEGSHPILSQNHVKQLLPNQWYYLNKVFLHFHVYAKFCLYPYLISQLETRGPMIL